MNNKKIAIPSLYHLRFTSKSCNFKVALLAAVTPLIAQHVGVWLVIAVRLVQVIPNHFFQITQHLNSCIV